MDDNKLKLKDIVPEYDSRNFLVRKLFFDRLKSAILMARLKRVWTVLDLGAGSCNVLRSLSKRGFPQENIHSLDFNRRILNLKKKYKKAHFKVSDIRKTGYRAETFDVVFCLDVLEHIEDLDNALTEIKRITKDKGLLVVSIPRENFFYKLGRFIIKGSFSMETGPGSGQHYYTSEQLISILNKHFRLFKMKKIKVLGIFHFFTICVFKINKIHN